MNDLFGGLFAPLITDSELRAIYRRSSLPLTVHLREAHSIEIYKRNESPFAFVGFVLRGEVVLIRDSFEGETEALAWADSWLTQHKRAHTDEQVQALTSLYRQAFDLAAFLPESAELLEVLRLMQERLIELPYALAEERGTLKQLLDAKRDARL